MLHLSSTCKYYLYSQDADMRKGFDSLSGIVSSQMQLNVLDSSVFIFLNKRHNQMKLLLWEGDGFALYHKRLEKGTFELPYSKNPSPAAQAAITITAQQLQLILQGISLQKIEFRKRYKRVA